jgi:predicted translin family RNA/ssDNA-binding protein
MGCTGSADVDRTPAGLELDFVAPEPGDDEERKIFELVSEALHDAPTHMEVLHDYTGCEEPIRKALNDPGQKTESAAWTAVSAAVAKLYGFYKFALELEKVWPQILDTLCTENTLLGVQNHLALAKQLAEIFDFVFHFDEAKMVNPAIQNDFSYYRRVLSRMKNANKDEKSKILLDEELANKMSFFFAYPTPMMKVLIDATMEFDKNAKPKLIDGLSLVSNLCLKFLEKDDGTKEKATMLALCAMTGCIILVDHLHDEGAFHKKSPIRIRSAIQKLKMTTSTSTDFLLNSLRFTTLHLNDESTMSSITRLLT